MTICLHIVWRGDNWSAVVAGAAEPIASGHNKDALVQCACELARKSNGEVHVYGELRELEMIYAYREGIEHTHGGGTD